MSRVRRTPQSVELLITGRCNLRCGYCAFFTGACEARDRPAAEWLRFFDELARAGVRAVRLQGGEPFVRPDLEVLLARLAARRIRWTILTNGTLITDARARSLARIGGCEQVQVSVDGSRPVIHDRWRGRGAWHGALRGLKLLQEHRVPVTVRVTIHRRNLDDLEKLFAMLIDELDIPVVSTNAAIPMGRGRRRPDRFALDTRELGRAMRVMLALDARYPGRLRALDGPLALGRLWRAIGQARRAGVDAFPRCGRLAGCEAPFRRLAVRPDGVIVPCDMLGHLELGRINRDPLLELWRGHHTLRQLRRRATLPLRSFAFCRGCTLIGYCTGQCPGHAWQETQTVDHPARYGCQREFLRAGGRPPGAGKRELAG